MYAQAEKRKERKSRAINTSAIQEKSKVKQGFGFRDNRPLAITQMKLQETANSNPQVKQVAQLQVVHRNGFNEDNNGVIQCFGILGMLALLGALGAGAYGLYRCWNAGREEQDPYNGYILPEGYDSDDDSDYTYDSEEDQDDTAEDRLDRMRHRGEVRRARGRIPTGRYQTPTGMTTLSGLNKQRMTQSRNAEYGGSTFGSIPPYARLKANIPIGVLRSLENPQSEVPTGLTDTQRLATALAFTLVHGSEEDRAPGTSAYSRAITRDFIRTGGLGHHPLDTEVFPARSTAQEQRDLMEGHTELTEQQRRALEEDSEPSSDEDDDHFLLRSQHV